jgi:hypothetical protein
MTDAHPAEPNRRPVVLSYGGGLDSFAMLLDAIRRGEKPDVVAICDVGDPDGCDPGEWPSTYRHIRDVARPLCERHGIEFVVIDGDRYPVRDARSLFAWLEARNQIPVSGPNRICTTIAKVERFERWLTDRFPDQVVEVWIGFEAGEEARVAKDPNAGKVQRQRKPGGARRLNRFPLIEQGLCRCRCEALVRELGYPVPRKSACVFCPYGTKEDWATFARELPEVFARVERLEAAKLARPTAKNGVRLSIKGYRKVRPGKLPPNPVRGVHYKAPTLREYISGTYRAQPKPCPVCGQAVKATKATGCSYLYDAPEEGRIAS